MATCLRAVERLSAAVLALICCTSVLRRRSAPAAENFLFATIGHFGAESYLDFYGGDKNKIVFKTWMSAENALSGIGHDIHIKNVNSGLFETFNAVSEQLSQFNDSNDAF